MNVIQYRQLDTYDEGFAVDLHCLDPVTQSTVVYATLYGDLGGLQYNLKLKLISTFYSCLGLEDTWSGLEITKWCTTRSDNHILYKYSSKLVGFRHQ